MPRESRQETLTKGIAVAENQLSGITQTLADRGGATLRGSIALGKDGRVHAVLVPTEHFRISKKIRSALIHIAVNPIMNNGMMSTHKVEAVRKAVIEAEQDAEFPVPERTKMVSTDIKRHSPRKVTTDTRRKSLGGVGIISPDLLTDLVMNTLQPTWNIQNANAA